MIENQHKSNMHQDLANEVTDFGAATMSQLPNLWARDCAKTGPE
jgi:hypothetical protein